MSELGPFETGFSVVRVLKERGVLLVRHMLAVDGSIVMLISISEEYLVIVEVLILDSETLRPVLNVTGRRTLLEYHV